MKIHALTTGAVRVKHSFLFPSRGVRRQLDLFLPGEFSDSLPIQCWAIEHEGVLRLVDTGETAAARDVPFARMHVRAQQELPGAMAAAGLDVDDVSEVVLTHAHGDHIDGLVHVRSRVLLNETELRSVNSPMGRVTRRVLRQPLPPGFAPETFVLDGGPFGAFARSRALSDDGRIMIVDTAGHTPGHVSVVCVDDSGRHVLLAGDAAASLATSRLHHGLLDNQGKHRPYGAHLRNRRRSQPYEPSSTRDGTAVDDLRRSGGPRDRSACLTDVESLGGHYALGNRASPFTYRPRAQPVRRAASARSPRTRTDPLASLLALRPARLTARRPEGEPRRGHLRRR